MKLQLESKEQQSHTLQKENVKQQSVLQSLIFSESLREDQVRLQPIIQSLPINELAKLLSGLEGKSNPTNRSIIDSFVDGRATNKGNYLQLQGPKIARPSGATIAQGIASMKPKGTQVKVSGDQYEVRAHLNPWIQVAYGKITAIDEITHYTKKPGPGWEFHNWLELRATGIDRTKPIIGQAYSNVVTTSPFTTPSSTFSPTAQPSLFHTQPHATLPPVPSGYTWTGGGSAATPYIPMRDPIARPVSPGFDVYSRDIGGRLIEVSFEKDSTASSGTRALGAHVEMAPKGSTYTGQRDYPMTSASYSGQGRGHVIDHADGDSITTSSAFNYVPENPAFNEGFRNHIVQQTRSTGGGFYDVVFDYSSTPARTTDGTAIPTTEHFMITPTVGTPIYSAVPMATYPSSRTIAAATPFYTSTTSYPTSPWQ